MGHTWTEHRSQSLLIAQLLALDGRALSKEAKMERKKKAKRGRGRNNHWERNVLSTGAPANCLAHEFMGRVGRRLDLDAALTPQGWWISAQQTTAQFDIGFSTFFSFLPSRHRHLPPREDPRPPPTSEVAQLWWIGILWVSNPLCGSLMSRRKNSAAPASSRRFSIKGKFSSVGVNFH